MLKPSMRKQSRPARTFFLAERVLIPFSLAVVLAASAGTGRAQVGLASPTLTTQVQSAAIAAGEQTSDTATLTGSTPLATGTITFNLYGPDDDTCGSPIFTTQVSVTGDGDYSSDSDPFTPTAPGTYRWIASYSGDALNNPVSGTCGDTNESVVVSPGPATHFSVGGPTNATAGSPENFAVTALDQYDNIATGYTGSVSFSSTDSFADLPGISPLTSGVGNFTVTYYTAGTQTVTAKDTVDSGITGTSPNVAVAAGPEDHLVIVQEPTDTTAGSSITPAVAIQIQDQFGNLTSSTASVTMAIGTNP
ncbi:MAG TPA: hypothetical protein VF751_05220, partial [Chthoniobacterales bacterium]